MAKQTGFDDEFVQLTCPNCGGEVKLKKAQIEEHFMELEGGGYAYIGTSAQSDGAYCTRCKTEFVRKQKIELKVLSGGGSLYVGGDLVGRDKIVTSIVNAGTGAVATGGGVASGAGGISIGGKPKKKKKENDDDDDDDQSDGVLVNGKRIA